MSLKKIGIIGVGNVGASLAYNLALKNLCSEIVLKDLRYDLAKAVSLDIGQSISTIENFTKITTAKKDEELSGCGIVIITAGVPRKPGMSRDDLLQINAKIINSIVKNVVKYNPNTILIIVSNPLDAMVYTALKQSNLDRNKVIGMAGLLDSSRMAYFIRQKRSNIKNVNAIVLGGHGDDMVPLIHESKIDGKPLDEVLNKDEIDEIIEDTQHGGIQIVKLLQVGSAYYAPAQSTALMIESIIKDDKKIYPCAVSLEGEYGYCNVVTGVPVKLGNNGIEEIIELNLSKEEKSNFDKSVESVKSLIEKL